MITWVKNNITAVIVAGVALLFALLRIKSDKIAALEHKISFTKHENKLQLQQVKVNKKVAAFEKEIEKLSEMEKEYYEKYGVIPGGNS